MRRARLLGLALVAAAAAPTAAASCGGVESAPGGGGAGGVMVIPTEGGPDARPDAQSDVSSSSATGGGGARGVGGAGGKGGEAGAGAAGGGGLGGAGGAGGVGGSGGVGGLGGSGGAGGAGDGGFGGLGGGGSAACGTVVSAFTPDPGIHEPICSPITWSTNPPSSGMHYPIWAAYKDYDKPVPRGFYVHDLEHGGVVIQYNCPSGCDAEVARLAAFLASRPPDPVCTVVRNRFVLTPDPLIPTPFAASAWGFTLTSDCFDLRALGDFIDAHYGQAPEPFVCSDGEDPTSPDAGFPSDCGQPPDGG